MSNRIQANGVLCDRCGVTPLDWDSDGKPSEPQRTEQPAPRVIEEPIPEDDIPF